MRQATLMDTYRVFFNVESKVNGQKSIQNLVSDANSGLILLVIVANLILYPKIHSEYIFELIISYEKKKVKMWDIDTFVLVFEYNIPCSSIWGLFSLKQPL